MQTQVDTWNKIIYLSEFSEKKSKIMICPYCENYLYDLCFNCVYKSQVNTEHNICKTILINCNHIFHIHCLEEMGK